jgi:hypothetical protein
MSSGTLRQIFVRNACGQALLVKCFVGSTHFVVLDKRLTGDRVRNE